MGAPTVYDAEPTEAQQIVTLLRNAYEPAWLDVMLYGCEGVAHFVEAQILLGRASAYRYKVCRKDREVVGVAEFRLIGKTLFLNNIAILAAGQGSGAGSALLREMVSEAAAHKLSMFSLDVLESNARARAWYERLGLAVTSERSYWRVTPPRMAGSSSFVISDYPHAEIVQARFGFSEFSVEGGEHAVKVGRLGARYFRLVGSQVATDNGLICFLGALDPTRDVLAIVDGRAPLEAPWEMIAVSKRMSVSIEALRFK